VGNDKITYRPRSAARRGSAAGATGSERGAWPVPACKAHARPAMLRLGLGKCWTTEKNARKLGFAIVKVSFDHLISVPAKTIIGPRL